MFHTSINYIKNYRKDRGDRIDLFTKKSKLSPPIY